MKNMTFFEFRGITFQFVQGCGLAIVEEDGSHATVESWEETEIRQEALRLIAAGDFSEFEFEPEEPEEEEEEQSWTAPAYTPAPQKGLRRVDSEDVVYIPCVVTGEDGQMEIMQEFLPCDVMKIENSVLGQTRFGVEIYRATLERVNLQRDNTCWTYVFSTNAGTLFR